LYLFWERRNLEVHGRFSADDPTSKNKTIKNRALKKKKMQVEQKYTFCHAYTESLVFDSG